MVAQQTPTPTSSPARRWLAPCTPEQIVDLIALVTSADTGEPDKARVADGTNNTDEPEPSWEQTFAVWHQKLADLDPATAPQDRSLVDAVIAHLDCGTLDDEQECAWRRYAYRTAGHLYAADDPHKATAAIDYVESLHVCGLYHQALPVQNEVVAFHPPRR